jgi:hypothetical protein
MAAPTITQTGFFKQISESTYTFAGPAITTPSDCLWLGVAVEEGVGTDMSVTSVASAGVTWSKVAEYTYSDPTWSPGTNIPYTMSLWKAPLGSRTTYAATNITVDFNATADAFAGAVWGVVGDYTPGGCTLDPNASLPATGGGQVGGSGDAVFEYSTSLSDDLLFLLLGSDSETGVSPTGWTFVTSGGINGVVHVTFSLWSLATTGPVTDVTIVFGNSPVDQMGLIVGESANSGGFSRSFYVTAGL